RRNPADVLITTPESLFLMLTSRARETLRGVDTVIVDEIHALVPGKRGAHLALSLERLERLSGRPLQRLGLSATQKPLEEVARFLGGAASPSPAPDAGAPRTEPGLPDAEAGIHVQFATEGAVRHRPVAIVDTGERKRLELRVEVPVEEMARPAPGGPSAARRTDPESRSIWPAIHPRLLELIRRHRSTLLFVNSRRLAERLAAALNELAGETIVHAHHGSLARPHRIEIEEQLRSGRLPALVATSSLELGIDMGAIDLVIQIEAPPSVASGMQRIGRASHHVGEASRGILVPKYRSDLLACAALVLAMTDGEVEPIAYPRNPLDVLAQQIVAMAALEPWDTDELFDLVRGAAPFATLSRPVFEGLLDMLSGRYPSDEFAELRPRIVRDRRANRISGRPGAQQIAVANAGTIPDRGLFGVFLAGADKGAARVGELDEEMVFESSPGEVFVLGASSWRIEEITHDRVMVTPAPGEPGKVPFWRGEAAGRSVGFGARIGALTREIGEGGRARALRALERGSRLDPQAAGHLVDFIAEQRAATGAVPDDRTVVIERVRDELGDWRVCVLSPLGGRVLAPWAMAVLANVRHERGIDLETMWTDDGFVVRFPDTPEPPGLGLMIPAAHRVESLVVRQLGSSALFAARFREAAARALLLPRRRPGRRAPLWQQRKRAADLLQVACRFGSFPILLETYRECLRDVFDLPSLLEVLRGIERGSIAVAGADTEKPSPFASNVLFRYVANYLYDGDAPLAERRAQALTVNRDQLRELMGEADLRQLLDPRAVEEAELHLQHLDERTKARGEDGIHDLLLRLGDLTPGEIEARSAGAEAAGWIGSLLRAQRAVELKIAGEVRLVAAEEASRYRDALGVELPGDLPDALLEAGVDPLGVLASRFARTRGPFTTRELAARYALASAVAESELRRLESEGRLLSGEFRPGGAGREWCHPEVLETIRRKSLAKLRREIEPVDPPALARLLAEWQGVGGRREGLNALLDAIEPLQGFPIAASILESAILPARIPTYRPADLDTLLAAGEIVWIGIDAIGSRDGRVALFLADAMPLLHLPSEPPPLDEREQRIVDHLAARGASFFTSIHEAAGGGFPADTVAILWELVWKGIVTNDSLHALRAFVRRGTSARNGRRTAFPSRRSIPPAGEGRWSLVAGLGGAAASPTERAHALARQLLTRYGVVGRESVAAESLPGGFASVYPVLRSLEESGRVRRGLFVAGMTAAQFAEPAAVDSLRSLRDEPSRPETLVLASSDPASPWGSIFRWPGGEGGGSRAVGTEVVLVNGKLAAHLSRGARRIVTFLPEEEPERGLVARELARALARPVREGKRSALLIEQIDGRPAGEHPLAPLLVEEGFRSTARGMQIAGRPDAVISHGI
ncbi:MAG TPA: helicase-related protein, partial [Thermoanaerobaculia bacterium]|nr:helicase-related protein [Thermoanaerobaculia bacterium]